MAKKDFSIRAVIECVEHILISCLLSGTIDVLPALTLDHVDPVEMFKRNKRVY